MKRGEMLAKMIHIATNAHDGQFDKGGVPYILHPLKVMHYLKTDDEELQCIALGHDVIEDTDVTYADLRDAGISERVIAGIAALTKLPGETLAEYKTTATFVVLRECAKRTLIVWPSTICFTWRSLPRWMNSN
jgi:(p)ppGpp synthase/HD superfamily hydrolase